MRWRDLSLNGLFSPVGEHLFMIGGQNVPSIEVKP